MYLCRLKFLCLILKTKTSILIFGSECAAKTEDVFIFKVKNDGYTLTTRRRPLPGINDLDEFIALHEEMLKNDYSIRLDQIIYFIFHEIRFLEIPTRVYYYHNILMLLKRGILD